MSRHTPKKMPKARSASRSVSAAGTPPGDAFGLALAAYQEGRFDDAEAILRGVLKQTPTDAGCWNNLGNLLQESGRLADAEAAFVQAIALIPEQPQFRTNLGNLLKLARRLPEAEAAYRKAVQLGPDDPANHNQLGLLLKEAGKFADAEAAFHRCLALHPGFADAHNNLGILFKEAGKLAEAEAAYRRARELNPEFAEPNNNLGIVLFEDERFEEAEAAFRRALQLRPTLANAHSNLGNLLRKTKRLAEAEAAYRSALELEPDFADAHNNLGILLKEADKPAEAEAAYRRALELNPEFAEAHDNLGALLLDDGRLPEAEAELRRAIALKPDFADAHSNLGNLLKQTRHLVEAEAAYRHSIELKPDVAGVHNNLAILLSQTARLDEAEAEFHRAVELQPEFLEAHNNYGNLLKEMGRVTEAEAAYRRALELKPESVDARLNLALLLLALGRYEEAWSWHEARHIPDSKARRAMQPPFTFPQWQGEPLAGKSLVVVLEQGAGDNFQFVRYAPLLKAQGLARLSFYQPGPFIPLQGTAQGIDFITSDPAAVAPHDFWVFPLSLPFHLGTTLDNLPNTLPYLWALPERIDKWRPRLPASGFKVGLVWKGNPDHQNDANRSLPHLSSLAPLWAVPGVSFVSLQKGQGEDEARQPPPGQPLLQVGDDIADFGDTAAIIAQLDLLITIDSAAAHVAGALGKPVWVLLPGFGTDWRWLLEREDSPWYPDVMRLFRQPRDATSWDATIANVAIALRDRVGMQPAATAPTPASDAVQPLRRVVLHDPSPAPVVVLADSTSPAPVDAAGLALAAYLAGRFGDAEAILRAALERDPGDSGCWNNLGNLLQETGRLAAAEAAFSRAIELVPGQHEFHGNLGNLLKLAQRLPEAEAAYRRAIDCAPDNAACHNQLGMLLGLAGRLPEAEAAYRRALELEPGLADAHNNLGILLKAEGKLPQAEAALRRALELSPAFAEAHNNLGIVLFEDERLADAEPCFRRALELKPDFADAHSNLGNLLKKAKRLPEAELAYHRALDLNPNDAKAHNNLGVLLHETERFAEGEAAYRKSLALNPDFAEAHCNLGILMQRFGRHADAEAAYRRALELNPQHTDSRLNLGMLLLLLGRYAEAWPYHEARYYPDTKERRAMHPTLPYPQWQGEPLAGKSLVVGTEQGYGDNIQFVRYAPLLKALGLARLTLVQTRALAPLIATVDDTVAVVSDVTDMPAHDYWCFALSLPLHLGTTLETIPATIPYLHVLPERAAQWRDRLPADGFKVGLVWKGNVDHKNDFRRSLPGLTSLAPLWEIPGVTFISLQKGQGEDEARQPPPGQPLLHVGDDIADFADTAAVIAELDLLISIDSAAAHVAGALGKPAWVLLPGVGTDWRWLLERTDSPWYPGSMRLFRQSPDATSWDETIQELASALRARFAVSPAPSFRLPEPSPPDLLPPAIDATAADALLLQAHSAFVGGRRDEAEARLRELLDRDPAHTAALNNLAGLLAESGRGAEAEAAYRRAIELNPGYADFHANFARFLMGAGRLAEAENAFRASLAANPAQPAILCILAQMLKESGRATEAEALFDQALALDPNYGGAYNNRGILLLDTGRAALAEDSFRRAIALDTNFAEGWTNLGNALKAQQRNAEAEAALRMAAALRPTDVQLLHNLAVFLDETQRTAEAEVILRRITGLAPNDEAGWNHLGMTLQKQQRWAEAEEAFRQAVALKPESVDALGNLGNVLQAQHHFADARDAFRRALALDPDNHSILSQLARLLKDTRRPAEAELAYRRILELKPTDIMARNNFGNLLLEGKRLAEAEASFRQALEIDPAFEATHSHLGNVLKAQNRLVDAEAEYRRALELRPDSVGASLNLAFLLFALGRYAEAWPHHEERFYRDTKDRQAPNPGLPCPQWQGEPLAGKSLVVVAEQGHGDNIQFARYAPLLKAAGASRLTFIQPASLIPLLATAHGVDAVVADAVSLPPDDYWVYPLSLPFHFGTTVDTIPDTLPYLWALPERIETWRPRLPATGLKLGLVWKGNPDHDNDANRSLPHLSTLAPLWDVPGISFISLQKGRGEEEARQAPATQPLLHLGDDIGDFADTAAIIAQLDLVITIDSAAAHLAGALGKPVWLLLPGFCTDWRWLLEREDSPWYPGVMRLFRQPGDETTWDNTIRRVAAALLEWSASPPALTTPRREDSPSAQVTILSSLRLRSTATTEEDPGASVANPGERLTPAEEEAECRALIAQMPDSAPHHFHLGVLLHAQDTRPADAEAAYRRTLQLDPGFAGVSWNLALLLLAQGRWLDAWPYFDRRSDPFRPGFTQQYPCPEWHGEDLAGKSLVIDSCESLGDNIMCARYVPLLKAAGASRVTLRHRASLKTLLETVEGVDAVVTDPRMLVPHDFWCFSFSLPIRFGTTPETVPASLPYLRTIDTRLAYWRRRLAPLTGLRVGLVWKGDPNLDADPQRSLPGLATLAPLWEVSGVSFVSLQKGQGEDEGLSPPPDQPLLHLGSDIDDFADSAAIIAQLDLLISVDTAAAHVAGALGRPVWLLLPGNSEWRWLRDRADTPWYPGVMRLFRQPRQSASWEDLIREVATALAARVRGEAELAPSPATTLSEPPTTAGQSEEFLLPLTGRELTVPPIAPPNPALAPIITEPALETSMKRPALRPVAFVLASSDHGTLIVNRNDYANQGGGSFGVGFQVLSNSSFDAAEVDLALQMLEFRRKLFGDGVMALDCGANIGVHTVEWSRLMHGWGSVIAVEAQERVFYALAGNISINNCFNARALWGAIGAENGEIVVPRPNYLQPGSFGSLEIRPSARNEFIGQAIDYSEQAGLRTRLFTIDSLALPRLDFIKIDIEGMEMEALAGAVNSIRKFRPQMMIEKIKSDENALRNWLVAEGYRLGSFGLNLVAVHTSDPSNAQLIV